MRLGMQLRKPSLDHMPLRQSHALAAPCLMKLQHTFPRCLLRGGALRSQYTSNRHDCKCGLTKTSAIFLLCILQVPVLCQRLGVMRGGGLMDRHQVC